MAAVESSTKMSINKKEESRTPRSASPAKNTPTKVEKIDINDIVLPPLPPVDYSGFQWNIPKFDEEVVVKQVDLPSEDIVIETNANDHRQIDLLKKRLTQYNKTFNITINRNHDDPPRLVEIHDDKPPKEEQHVTAFRPPCSQANAIAAAAAANHQQQFVRNEVKKIEAFKERPIDVEYVPTSGQHQHQHQHQSQNYQHQVQTYRTPPCRTGRCNESLATTSSHLATSVSPDRYAYRTSEYRQQPETFRGSSLARCNETRTPIEYSMTTTVSSKQRGDRWGVLIKSIKKSLKAKEYC